MTVHVLHAGDGYDYLTRQVAAADVQLRAGDGLADYYTASGEPPGVWMGRGVAGLGVSGLVREDQMAALFGEGLHPEADAMIAAAIYDGASASAAIASAQLGRPFPRYRNETPFNLALRAAYTRHRELTGTHARADQRLVIRCRVAERVFAEVYGRRPANRAEVDLFLATQRRLERQPVSGYDLVFTPVKSVSTLWAVGSQQVRTAVEEAHRAAVGAALAFLEEHAAFTRTGAGGAAQIDTHGLVATAFTHRTSRTGDPNLHTHLVVANRIRGVDGRWRTVDGRMIHHVAVATSETYTTAIETELTARLGVQFTGVPRTDGKREVREIVGVDERLTALFSGRRSAIEEQYRVLVADYRDRYGREPSRKAQYGLAQQASLQTRPDKAPGRSLAELRADWRRQAIGVLGSADLQRMLASVTASRAPAGGGEVDVHAVAEQVVQAVSRSRSTWNRWHVHAEATRVLRAVPGYLTAAAVDRSDMVERVVEAALGPARSILLTVDTDSVPELLRRSDGASVLRVHGADRYTSRSVLDAEGRLLTAARTLTPHTVHTATVGAAIARTEHATGRHLDPGQRALVSHFTTAGTALAVAVGPAGSGKTTALRATTDAWRQSGRRVVGLAPSARAATVLHTEIGIDTHTLARLLVRWRAGRLRPGDIRPGDMLLVDEAGMAATHDLDDLHALATATGAVIRLIGDPHQGGCLPPRPTRSS